MEDNSLDKNSYPLQKYSETKFKTIHSSLKLKKAIALMKQEQISCLLVESQLKLVGILTEKNIVELIYSGEDFSSLNVEQLMTRNPIVLKVETNLSSTEIARVFQRYSISYLPIINHEGKGVGLITPSSVLGNFNFQEVNNKLESPENDSDGGIKQSTAEKVYLQDFIQNTPQQDRKFLQTVFEQMPGGVIIVEAFSGKCLLTNDLFTEIFRREIAPINIFEEYLYFGLLEDDHSSSPSENYLFVRALASSPVRGEEMKFLCGDGVIRTFLVNSAPVYNSQGSIIAAIATFHDLKQARSVKQEAANKLIFLKEIHHRIKNNLQVISALLDLQSEQIQDEAAYSLLEKSQARIQTMALIYEKVFSSGNIEEIDFTEYVTSLTRYLYDSFIEDYQQIDLSLDIEPIRLSIDLATPCGLIINELVTNSLQHGFKNQDWGRIQINFFLDQENQYNLQIADNGSGMNPQILIQNNPEFLGISMVKSLVIEQLKGTWNSFSSNGCAIEITFPRNTNRNNMN